MRGIHILCFIAGVFFSTVAMKGQEGSVDFSKQQTGVEKAFIASITGGGDVCEGDSILAYISMNGTSPCSIVIDNSSGYYDSIEVISSPYELWLKPEMDDVYIISSAVDGDGDTGSTYGSASVTLKYSTPVNILMDHTSFKSSDPGVELKADHEPGVFSGLGVSDGYFYPSVATSDGSPHTINYRYSNEFHCRSYDSIQLSVIEGTGSVVLLSGEDTISVLCSDEGIYEIVGTNEDGIAGSFELRLTNSSTIVPGHIADSDPSDNRALFNPTGLDGGYDIIYDYSHDGVDLTASTFVRVDIIPALSFTSSPPNVVCKNAEPYVLEGNLDNTDPLATWSFSGDGVYGSMSDGFFYDPGDPAVQVGSMEIRYTYSTESGCKDSISKTIENVVVPDAYFKINTSCISEEGSEIEFDNWTTEKHAVETWSWNFGDVSSGSNNYSNEKYPVHFYRNPGLRRINLTATSIDGCISYYALDTLLVGSPDVDFTWISDCYVRGEKVKFVNKSEVLYSNIDTLVWSFKTAGGSILGEMGKSPGDDTIQFPFTSIDTYQVELYVENTEGCDNSLSKEITLNQTNLLSKYGRLENFNATKGGWSVQSENDNNSWVWDVPDFNGFEPSSGNKAWYTDLPYMVSGYEENSWIESPCFDFSQMNRPLISMDVMKSFVPNLSGAVLQYQDNADEGWLTIGELDGGIGWYNSGSLFNLPGGSSFGWGLNSFNPDEDWVEATHDLDTIAGNSHVKFRIAIASDGGQSIGNQGFAVDNIHFAERSKKSLLEHFTNSSDQASQIADDFVDAYYSEHPLDVIDVQYHTDYPGFDPMNENNPGPASTRSGPLGVGQVPFALLDGGASLNLRYDFSSAENSPGGEELSLLTLEIPKFNIGIQMNWLDNSLQADVIVSCNTDSYVNNVQLFVAIIESEVTAYTGGNGDTHFRNVVLDMLPDPSGELIGGEWSRGDSQTRSFTWDYKYHEDVEDLGVIAFVQDRVNEKILQTSSSHMDSQLGFRDPQDETLALSVYPNPASELLYISFAEPSQNEGRLEITDLSGRVVMESVLAPGHEIYQLQISSLQQGIYLICWFEEGRLKGRNKVIRTL